MEISGTSTGAATYALKKAMQMPDTLLNLLFQQQGSQDLATAPATPSDPVPDTFNTTGKGGIIDIIV